MKLNSGEFETEIDSDGDFQVSIKTEGAYSNDGGYTYEDVTGCFCLDKVNAKHLIEELQHYVSNSC